MLENRLHDALGSLVETVETVQTVETVDTVQTVQSLNFRQLPSTNSRLSQE